MFLQNVMGNNVTKGWITTEGDDGQVGFHETELESNCEAPNI